MAERTAMRRNGQPDDIADDAQWLCAPSASWVTGQLVAVDGMAAEELIPKDIPDL
jgi:NAD(P)-dependent dehydrogenase (short-subunit alcohol dehydrogenase family)